MGGAPNLPTPSTPGYTSWTDCYQRKWTVCTCLGQWLTAAQDLGLARGLIKQGLDIVQTTGGVAASGGTHTKGGVFDVLQRSREWSHLFREMGAAGWPRLDPNPTKPGDAWDDNEHFHGVLDGCPHNAPAAYQVTAYWRGYSGLGQAKTGTYAGQWGYGSKDPDPWRPTTRRTWREGIAWAQAQINQQEDDMPISDADIDRIKLAILGYKNAKMNGTKDVYQVLTDAANPRVQAPDDWPYKDKQQDWSLNYAVYNLEAEVAEQGKALAEQGKSLIAITQALADLAAKVDALGKATGA